MSGEMDGMDGMDGMGRRACGESFWVWGGDLVVSLVPSSTTGYEPSSLRDEEAGRRELRDVAIKC